MQLLTCPLLRGVVVPYAAPLCVASTSYRSFRDRPSFRSSAPLIARAQINLLQRMLRCTGQGLRECGPRSTNQLFFISVETDRVPRDSSGIRPLGGNSQILWASPLGPAIRQTFEPTAASRKFGVSQRQSRQLVFPSFEHGWDPPALQEPSWERRLTVPSPAPRGDHGPDRRIGGKDGLARTCSNSVTGRCLL